MAGIGIFPPPGRGRGPLGEWEGANGGRGLRTVCTEYFYQILLYLRKMLVRKQFVYRNVIASVTEMRRLSRLLSGSRRSRDGGDMNLVIDEPCCCKRKRRQLYSGGKTSRIRYVVSLAYLLLCTFAKTICKMPSGIISLKSEIIAEIDYPAFRRYVVAVNKLP